MQQDNTLLRNFIADGNLDSPKVQPRCSECAKSLKASQPPANQGPDSTLLLTLNKQLQQQLQQAQLQLQQQQKKSKEQLEQQQIQTKVGVKGRGSSNVACWRRSFALSTIQWDLKVKV